MTFAFGRTALLVCAISAARVTTSIGIFGCDAADPEDEEPINVILQDVELPAAHIVLLWYHDGPGIFRVVMQTKSGFRSFGDIQFD